MGILNSLSKFFPDPSGAEGSFWSSIPDADTLDKIMSEDSGTIVIFKDSPYCGTSMFAGMSLNTIDPENWKGIHFYRVDVIKERQISDRISQLTGVRHESPQLLVISNGSVYWHGSHSRVNAEQLSNTLKSL